MDKQKQIEEMYQEILRYKFVESTPETFSYKKMCAYLYGEGYRKIPENAVVVTREEYEALTSDLDKTDYGDFENGYSQGYKQAGKETAEKFAERVKEETDHGISALYDSKVDEICKEITEGEDD